MRLHVSLSQMVGRALATLSLCLMSFMTGGAFAAGFTSADSLNYAREYARTVTLQDGKVITIGGPAQNGAELLDPITGKYTTTGAMQATRGSHTATLLPSGKVLITGGGNYLSSAELYDPITKTFSATGSMSIGRTWHAATLLPNGKVLVTGGYSYNGGIVWGTTSAELYDPTTGVFTTTGNMIGARCQQLSQLLPNGKVLVAGGWSAAGGRLATAEIYDPAAGTFSSTGSMTVRRSNMSLLNIMLDDGKVLVGGGYNDTSTYLNSAEVYEYQNNAFRAVGPMVGTRANASMVRLPSGKVLVVGGDNSSGYLSSTTIYNPATETFSTGPNMNAYRALSGVVTFSCWNVAVIGGSGLEPGQGVASPLATTERFCE